MVAPRSLLSVTNCGYIAPFPGSPLPGAFSLLNKVTLFNSTSSVNVTGTAGNLATQLSFMGFGSTIPLTYTTTSGLVLILFTIPMFWAPGSTSVYAFWQFIYGASSLVSAPANNFKDGSGLTNAQYFNGRLSIAGITQSQSQYVTHSQVIPLTLLRNTQYWFDVGIAMYDPGTASTITVSQWSMYLIEA